MFGLVDECLSQGVEITAYELRALILMDICTLITTSEELNLHELNCALQITGITSSLLQNCPSMKETTSCNENCPPLNKVLVVKSFSREIIFSTNAPDLMTNDCFLTNSSKCRFKNCTGNQSTTLTEIGLKTY